MRKNRKSSVKKERIIMIASSAFVLTALTLTGIYMQAGEEKSQDDGYTLDFTAIEDNLENKNREIAMNAPMTDNSQKTFDVSDHLNLEDDLDYMPLEAGSGNIEIPGMTTVLGEESLPEKEAKGDKKDPGDEADMSEAAEGGQQADAGTEPLNVEPVNPQPVNTEPVITEPVNTEPVNTDPVNVEQAAADAGSGLELHFAESNGLQRPLEGEALIPFSMNGGVYFSTLDLYKYNPALMLAAQEGTAVYACAAGQVVDIFQDSEIGQAVTMDLGDGYKITYGQLKGLNVALNSYVNSGDMIGSVAAPTKYFIREGANLYLKLTQNEEPVDPELLFR